MYQDLTWWERPCAIRGPFVNYVGDGGSCTQLSREVAAYCGSSVNFVEPPRENTGRIKQVWTRHDARSRLLSTTTLRVAVSILYTPSQLRDALGLTKETFRYWRRCVPALNGGQSQRPRFGPSDLLATAVLKRLTEITGVPVGRLSPLADGLFTLCRGSAWPQLERMSAIIYLERNEIRLVAADATVQASVTAVVFPLRDVVVALREHLHEAEFDPQASIAFPPLVLAQRGTT